jgi:hypothetical protein
MSLYYFMHSFIPRLVRNTHNLVFLSGIFSNAILLTHYFTASFIQAFPRDCPFLPFMATLEDLDLFTEVPFLLFRVQSVHLTPPMLLRWPTSVTLL